MEKGLRECCRSMRIGKILIRRDRDTKLPRVRLQLKNLFYSHSVERLFFRFNLAMVVRIPI